MEPSIINHKIEKLDRHGYKTNVSPIEISHTITLNIEGETHTVKTSLTPTISEWSEAMDRLKACAINGHVNQRKVIK